MTIEEQQEQFKQFIREHYPEIPEDKVFEAAERMRMYLELIWRIAKRRGQE